MAKEDLRLMLENAWNERFSDDFQMDQREAKTLKSPLGLELCRVIYSRKLEEWYLSPAGQARYEKAGCFFCDGYGQQEGSETVVQFGHLKIYCNLKFVAKCHFLLAPLSEHREHPSKADVRVLRELALLSGLSILGNFRDSGASYPQHVHYQSLETVFPITERPAENIFSTGSVSVARIDYPVAVFSLSSTDKDGVESIAQAISVLQYPINLLFWGEKVFLVPRTKSIPSNTHGFKFAAAEVFGLVFTRTRDLYTAFDYGMMLTALREVCLPIGSHAAESFQERLIGVLGNH